MGRKRGFGQPSVEVARRAEVEQTIDDDVGSRAAQGGVCVYGDEPIRITGRPESRQRCVVYVFGLRKSRLKHPSWQ